MMKKMSAGEPQLAIMAALGAESLNAARAEDSVVAIAQVIQSGLGVLSCDIYLRGDSAHGVRRIARATGAAGGLPRPRDPSPRALGRAAAGLAISELADGRSRVAQTPDLQSTLALLLAQEPRALLIPLRVKGEPVGVLRIEGDPAVTLDSAQCRFAEALAYYAALALERVGLAAEAAHADSLREADRLKDSLLASVSHDLRTPLTTIKALSHAIAAEGDERARIVEEEADRLNAFVSDLLDLSRLNAGAFTVMPDLVAAEDVLGAALQQVSGSINGRELLASVEPGESLLVGRFDFVHTLRALVNLIGNALKYSGPDGVVAVSARGAPVCGQPRAYCLRRSSLLSSMDTPPAASCSSAPTTLVSTATRSVRSPRTSTTRPTSWLPRRLRRPTPSAEHHPTTSREPRPTGRGSRVSSPGAVTG